MVGTRQSSGPETPERLLDSAAQAVTQALDRLLDSVPAAGKDSHEQLREVARQCARLTGGLAEVAATAAVRLDAHGRSCVLHEADGGDSTAHFARATRRLTELRQALVDAERAASGYHESLSRLAVAADPALPAVETSDPAERGEE